MSVSESDLLRERNPILVIYQCLSFIVLFIVLCCLVFFNASDEKLELIFLCTQCHKSWQELKEEDTKKPQQQQQQAL